MNLREKKLDLLGQRKTKLDEAQNALTEKGSSSEEYKAAMEAVKQLNEELLEVERLITEAEKSPRGLLFPARRRSTAPSSRC